MSVSDGLRLVARDARPAGTVVEVRGVRIGGPDVVIIAGPCAVESEAQLLATARAVKAGGASVLRGGAFKPRTSPYSFRGLELEGLRLLALARAETGLPVVTEVMDARHLPRRRGAAPTSCRSARATCRTSRCSRRSAAAACPCSSSAGMSATLAEYLQAAEYVLAAGNDAGDPLRARHPHLRDLHPQHARPERRADAAPRDAPAGAGGPEPRHRPRVDGAALASAAVAAGADGLLVEVHCDPGAALSDGDQLPDAGRVRADGPAGGRRRGGRGPRHRDESPVPRRSSSRWRPSHGGLGQDPVADPVRVGRRGNARNGIDELSSPA